jgi:hypothetical protein
MDPRTRNPGAARLAAEGQGRPSAHPSRYSFFPSIIFAAFSPPLAA